MRRLNRILALLLVAIMLLSPITFADNKTIEANPEGIFFGLVTDFILEVYQFDISKDELLERTFQTLLKENPEALDVFLRALFGSLDQYSEFYSGQEWNNFLKMMENVSGGIGVQINKRGRYVEVVALIDDSPAQKAGIRPGDRFIEVNGQNVVDMKQDYFAALLGGEIGTKVSVKILRGEEVLEFELVRFELKQDSVFYYKVGDAAAHIYVTSFNMTTAEELKKALEEIDDAGIKKIVLDLRYNPGGYVISAVEVANMFVPEGKIATLKYKAQEKPEEYFSTLKQTKYELVVLVNDNTASAAEILGSAIQDSKAGKIVGVQSFGKGIVQTFFPVYADRVCKITTGEYLTRNGNTIHEKGIIPDIIVNNRELHIMDTTITPIDYKEQYKMGDTGKGVLAYKQRLNLLGINVGTIDENYDENMYYGVMAFQEAVSLEQTGVLDITTQIYLDNESSKGRVTVDKQLATAFDLLGVDNPTLIREDIK